MILKNDAKNTVYGTCEQRGNVKENRNEIYLELRRDSGNCWDT